MDSLSKQIIEILSLPQFANLNKVQKNTVRECILTNCLILSKEKQQYYLELIKNNLVSVEDLGEENYYKDNICYGGIVENKIVRNTLDEEGMIYPLNYHLKYREYKEPIGRLTKSVLHEFGHMVVKKTTINLEEGKGSTNGGLLMDMGGLIINESFTRDYGHAFCEIINEFTNFLAFKAYLSYTEIDINAIEKMKAFAQVNGLKYEENINYLSILPDNLFTSFSESLLAMETMPEGTKEMFNSLYVKYTPLVKLIMHSFQNPCCTYQDLVKAFQNQEGLYAKKDGKPINDLLYGYYESSFHVQELFDQFMGDRITWEQFCTTFDKEMFKSQINYDFITESIEIFTNFYKKRVEDSVKKGDITEKDASNLLNDYEKTVNDCLTYYESKPKSK